MLYLKLIDKRTSKLHEKKKLIVINNKHRSASGTEGLLVEYKFKKTKLLFIDHGGERNLTVGWANDLHEADLMELY